MLLPGGPSARCPSPNANGPEILCCNNARRVPAADQCPIGGLEARARIAQVLDIRIAAHHHGHYKGRVDHLPEAELLREVVGSAEQVHGGAPCARSPWLAPEAARDVHCEHPPALFAGQLFSVIARLVRRQPQPRSGRRLGQVAISRW